MWNKFAKISNKIYINILPDIVKNYNNKKHSSIMTPMEGSKPKNIKTYIIIYTVKFFVMI